MQPTSTSLCKQLQNPRLPFNAQRNQQSLSCDDYSPKTRKLERMFSPIAQAELAKEQVHASSETKVHKLAVGLGMFGAHQSSCMAQERSADGDFRTLPAAAWHCIHARFEAHAEGFHSSRRNILFELCSAGRGCSISAKRQHRQGTDGSNHPCSIFVGGAPNTSTNTKLWQRPWGFSGRTICVFLDEVAFEGI